MAGVVVVTDSTSSLSPQTAAREGIEIVPLQVVIDDETGTESTDGQAGSISPSDVAAALRAGRRVTTSRPAPEAFGAVYARLADDGATAIVSIHLSGAMSGTVDAARLAAEAARVPVTVVDSRSTGMAQGFAAVAASRAGRQGADAASVAAVAERRSAAATTYLTVATLEWLRRGGRIGAASALLGNALAVKPVLTLVDGKISLHERVRTTSRAIARLEELGLAALARAAGGHPRVDVAVHHLDHAEAAEALAERLRSRVPTDVDVVVAELSSVIGVHVGPGTLGIVVSPEVEAPLQR